MLKRNVKRKRISESKRYLTLIIFIVSDMKNTEYLNRIYEFAEILWAKEKRDEQKTNVPKPT